jgi:hypothetical protein
VAKFRASLDVASPRPSPLLTPSIGDVQPACARQTLAYYGGGTMLPYKVQGRLPDGAAGSVMPQHLLF